MSTKASEGSKATVVHTERESSSSTQSDLLSRALQELNDVLGAQKEMKIETVASKDDKSNVLSINIEVAESKRSEAKVGMAIKKGANQKGKRNALGRGLSALMTSNTLEVPVSETISASDFDNASRAAIMGAKKDSLPRVLQVSKDLNSETSAPEPFNIVRPPAPRQIPTRSTTNAASDNSASAGTRSTLTLDAGAPNSAPRPLQAVADKSTDIASIEGLIEVTLSSLVANPDQPRQHFSDEEIAELAKSLLQSGVLQPILVRTAKGALAENGRYEIIAGERRVRAAKKAGLKVVPALLRELDDREVLEVSIVENVQRSQLNAVEEAKAYSRLQSEFGLSQEEVAKTVGKDRATVANSLRLLKLSDEVQDMLVAEQLSAGHARALLMLDNEAEQNAAAKKIVEQLLSVRATEQLVRDRKSTQGAKKSSKGKDNAASATTIQRQALEERFRRALSTKVALRLNSKGAGELKISFFSQEELDKLIEIIGA